MEGFRKTGSKTQQALLKKPFLNWNPGLPALPGLLMQGILTPTIECGMAKAVRIGAENGKQLLKMVGKDAAYLATEACSLEEAEQILDAWVDQDAKVKMGEGL